MHIRRSTWQSTVLTVLAVFSMSIWTVAPAVAATAKGHAAVKSVNKTAKATRCAKRNKASGTIKYSDWQFPDTLNQYQTGASVSQETIDSLYEGLTGFNSKGNVYPDLLAKLPKPQSGGKLYTATLRQGMRWSDGREITAQDVAFGWKIGMDPGSGPWCATTCDAISRIDTKGKYTVIFHLKKVYSPFVTNALFQIPVWPTSWKSAWSNGDVKAAVNKLFQDTTFNFENSTDFPTDGAYEVASFSQNDRIVLRPMKYYSTLSCGGRVQSLIFAFYSSKPGLIAAAASRATDETTDYTGADLKELNGHKTFKTYVVPGFLFEHFVFNHDATYHGAPNPLHDVRVRQALALALDKTGLLQSALGMSKSQVGQIIGWSPLIVTPTFKQPFADTKLKGQWDPIAKKFITATGTGQALADAKKLLAQAGHPGGNFSLDGITTTGNPTRQAEFSVAQSSWAKIGVTFKPNYMPASKLFSDYSKGSPLHTGDFQIAMYTSVGYPDPDGLRTSVDSHYIDREKPVHSTINANDGAVKDKVIDNAMAKGSSTFSKALRQQYYNEFQVQMNKQAHWVLLYYRFEIATHDGRIGNFATNPTNLGEQWNVYNWFPKGAS